jgi:hypothetical protein
VFAGDGQVISQWGNVLEAADVPSTMPVRTLSLKSEPDGTAVSSSKKSFP